jgi:C4-dicarboxylate transporter
MGIVMGMGKLLEGVSGKYKDVMELMKFLEGMSKEYKNVIEIN